MSFQSIPNAAAAVKGIIQLAGDLTGSATAPRIKPTFQAYDGATGADATTTSTSFVDITGASWTYTSGSVAETLLLFGMLTIRNQSAGLGTHSQLVCDTTSIKKSLEFSSNWVPQVFFGSYNVAASTDVTVKLQFRTGGFGGTAGVYRAADYQPRVMLVAIAQ